MTFGAEDHDVVAATFFPRVIISISIYVMTMEVFLSWVVFFLTSFTMFVVERNPSL